MDFLYPAWLDSLNSFGSIDMWFQEALTGVVSVLVAAGAIYVAFIGWRAFKAATNKV